jgi:hypothetical protein
MNSLTTTTMRHFIALAVLLALSLTAFAEDVRLQPLKDLNGYFPFTPPRSLPEWEQRKESVRRQILVAAGLWPMPTRTPLGAVIHGRIDCDGYTVEKVYFESAPGFFVTGNLYRPKNIQGRVPGVMFAHGHRENARLYLTPDDTLRKSIADGAKYLDLPGLLALHAPRPLWLAGEGPGPALITAAYRAASSADGLVTFTGDAAQQEAAAGLWLLK